MPNGQLSVLSYAEAKDQFGETLEGLPLCIITNPQFAFVKIVKDIKAGQELMVMYGYSKRARRNIGYEVSKERSPKTERQQINEAKRTTAENNIKHKNKVKRLLDACHGQGRKRKKFITYI